MKKEKEKIEKNKYDDDEIKVFEKIKKLDVEHKKLYCLYAIVILLIIQIVLPYLTNIKLDNNKNNIFSNEQVNSDDYDVSSFDEISANDLSSVVNSSEIQIVYIGRKSCQFCVQFLPILKKAQDEYGYKTKYIDLEKVSEEDSEKILALDNDKGFIKETFGSTPMILSFQNGKLIQGLVGYTEYEGFEEFLKMSNVTKK